MSAYKSYVPWSKRERENSYGSTKSDSSTQQNDGGCSYKPKSNPGGVGGNSFIGRGPSSSASQLPSYRAAYSSVGQANRNRSASKDRTIPSYSSSYGIKRDKEKQDNERTSTYKYQGGGRKFSRRRDTSRPESPSGNSDRSRHRLASSSLNTYYRASRLFSAPGSKDPERNRLHAGVEDGVGGGGGGGKSPLSGSRSSLLEKYSNNRDAPIVKNSDRPTSVLDKYTRGISRERSREPDVVPRFVSSTYPGSRNYPGEHRPPDKKERSEHPPVSYRGIRAPVAGRSSREPSPEIATGKTGCYRSYSRVPSYGRTSSGSISSNAESGSTPIGSSSRYVSGAGSRFGIGSRVTSDHVPTAISYSGSDRFRATSSGSKRSMTPMKDDIVNRNAVQRGEVTKKIELDKKLREKSEGNGVERRRNFDKKNDYEDNGGKGEKEEEEEEEEEVEEDEEDEGDEEEEEEEEEEDDNDDDDDDADKKDDGELVKLTVITRGTSPSAPASSSFVRTRRAETARMIEKEITRPKRRPEMRDREMQSDRMDDTARYSRFGGGRVAVTPWSSYLDKYSGNASSNSSTSYVPSSRSYGSSRIGSFGFTPTTTSRIAAPIASGAGFQESSRSSSTSKLGNESVSRESNQMANGSRIGFVPPSRGASPAKSDGSVSDLKSDAVYEDEEVSASKGKKNCQRSQSREEVNQRIVKGGTSNESRSDLGKLSKSMSRNELRNENGNQRRSSTPKFEKYEDPGGQRREGIQIKKDGSQPRRDSISKSDSGSSAGKSSFKNKSSSQKLSRNDSTESGVSVANVRSKSSSASSMTSLGLNKARSTPPPASGKSSQGNSRQGTPSDGSAARGKPPVPKSDSSAVAKGPGSMKYVNKDFRKSALNMEGGDMSRSKLERKRLKKRRSVSISSQDSQSEANSESVNHTASSGSSTSTSAKSARSGSKLKPPSNFSKGFIPRVGGSPQQRSESAASNLDANRSPRSFSKSPSRSKKHGSRSATSSSESISSESSSSSDDEQRSNSRRRRRRASGSPGEKRARSSAGSSRTSVLASSADELSLATDRPPRPPASPKSRSEASGKTEEAKSFLMRALAPVTNLFKGKHQESGESNGTEASFTEVQAKKNGGMSLSKSITQSLSKSLSFTNNSNDKNDKKKNNNFHKLTHQVSGEKAWWMEQGSDHVPEGVEKVNVNNDDISQDTTASNALSDDGKFKFKIWRQDSSDKAWWVEQSSENVSEDVRKDSSPSSPVSRRDSSRGSGKSERRSRIRHQQSGERAWWLSEDPESVPEGVEMIQVPRAVTPQETENFPRTIGGPIRHIDSGEKAWWMDSSANVPEGVEKIRSADTSISSSDSSESLEKVEIGVDPRTEVQIRRSLSRFPIEFPPPPPDEPLGDRASPEGVENPPDPPDSYGGRDSPYDNVQPSKEISQQRKTPPRKRPSTLPLFIGNHTNIDDLLGTANTPRHSPPISRIRRNKERVEESSGESSECEEIDADQVIIHDSTPQIPIIRRRNRDSERLQPDGYIPLDDTALQLYKDGDYGAYLDLEASITEQQEEFEGFQTNRKNSIVLRTQLSVRVHTIIEKLLNSEGRELRRALFSLKQIFQEDKDLVHEFVQNDGLACLIKVGNEADQNYQNYILRALGQVMLYVDGMNGVMEHGQTVQWLYTLIASRFRLVVKTALKLLLVFVEYVETNSLLLVRAVRSVDTSRGMIPWTNIMKLLKDYDAADTELLIYATTLVNKCLNGIPDQDTYYDQVDCLEEQGIEGIIQRYMSKQGTDLDLLRQFQIYEAVLHHEDGDEKGTPIRQLDDNIRKTLRNRKSLVDSHERRKSRRHSTGTSPLSMSLNARLSPRLNHTLGIGSLNTTNSSLPDDGDESSSSQSSQGLGDVQLNGSYKENKIDVGVTPALRRRRERAERQRSFIREQQEATANMRASIGNSDDQESSFTGNGHRYANGVSSPYDGNADSPSNKLSRGNSRKDLTPLMNAANKFDSEEKKPWYGKSPDEGVECDEENQTDEEDQDRRVVLQLKREGTVKDLTQKLAAQNLIPSSPVEDKVSRIGDMSGLISKAKEGLAKSKSKADVLKSPTGENIPKLVEPKKSENELHWEELASKMTRPLALCDLDFTDLNSEDEVDVLSPVSVANGVPPPPPPMAGRGPPPPPPGARLPPPPLPTGAPPLFGANLKSQRNSSANPGDAANSPKSPILANKKSKKTVKLFWKEVRDDPIILSRLDKNKMIWDELSPVLVDTQKLEHLFESRAKDLITKKQQEMNKNKEIIVLDHKRSNAINIGMTKLPPPRSIKTAILKMDATIMNREGIEKLLTMLPTEEERSRIQEAQAASPDLPLGSAEQFLLTLASISELPARLKLWAFKLDFENSEKEIADPLMDLKQGMETLKVNKTFRGILSTLLSIGIFLNGNEVKGFQLEYLAKVPEVKDTVHKHSLLHHLCHMVMEKFPDSTDLYSEIGAVTRASKIDFDELSGNVGKLENECKASWDHLKLIAKHDGSTMMKVKMSDFLSDCAERIIVLGIVQRRIINRFHKFILWLGIPLHRLQDTKPNEFCRIISEFALEFRTTRERVIQQLEKKANHRERNKTRGKMITEVGKFRTKEDREDAELRQVLGCDIPNVETIHGTLPWRRQRKEGRTVLGPLLRDESANGNLTDGDDELLESLVKTATKSPATRTTPRERKRTRHADRKSLRRTLKNGLSEEEKKHIAAYIKGY